MKTILTMALFGCFAASGMLAAQSAQMSKANVAAAIKGTLGTFKCTVGKEHHSSTFSPLFGGNSAMKIDEAQAHQLVTFDFKRQKWIDEYIGSDGSYSVMEGTPVKGGIDFTAVYPAGFNANLKVRYSSNGTMSTVFSTTMNGKSYAENELCVK